MRTALGRYLRRGGAGRDAGRMVRVLIVDDEPALREVEREIVEDAGYEADEVGTAAEALERLRASAEGLVVILDNKLPDMDGAEVLRTVEQDPQLARHGYIFATGVAPAEYSPELRRSLEALDVQVVPKPFDLDPLLAAIARAEKRAGGDGWSGAE